MQKIKINRQRVVFFILILFLTAELAVLLPWEIKKIIVLNKKIAISVRDIRAIEKEWSNKNNYLNNKKQLEEELKKIYSKFIFSQQESKLLSFISTSGRDFKVEIQVLSPGKPGSYALTDFGKFEYLPINITAKSKFHNLVMFLDHLQSSRHFLEVKSLKISSGQPYNSLKMVICGLAGEK